VSPYCPVEGLVAYILLQKLSPNHGVRNAEARMLQEFLHGISKKLMIGTFL